MTEKLFNTKTGANPAVALKCFIKGLQLLSRPELRKYIIFPVLVNLLLFSTVLLLGYHYIAELIAQFIPGWLSWLSWILWPIFFISFFIFGYFSFTLLANLIASPFYGKLSARTLQIVTGEAVAIAEAPLPTVLWAECKRLGYIASRALPLLLLFFIPGVNFIAPLLWMVFGAWGLVLEYMAYPLENQGLLFSEQRQQLKTIRIGALSFGALTVLALTLPLLNIIVPPAAVIGATIYANELKTKQP